MMTKPEIFPKLLLSLSSTNANLEDVIDFVLHVIYNRPYSETSPGESRYAMLFKGKKELRTFNSLQILPPDSKSLKMKILRANYMTYVMSNCLNPNFVNLNPLDYGWQLEDSNLVPIWYLGDPLPSNDELKSKSNENDFEVESSSKSNESINYSDESDDEIYDNLSEHDLSSDSDID